MTFRLVHAHFERNSKRAYVELRENDEDGGEMIVAAIFSFRLAPPSSQSALSNKRSRRRLPIRCEGHPSASILKRPGPKEFNLVRQEPRLIRWTRRVLLSLCYGFLFLMFFVVENIGLRVNTISVLASAFTILFLYLIAVKLIENYRGKTPKSTLDAVATYLAASIGALSFSFSDTFWFNGVEAEVYASSIFLVAFVTWLIITWAEKADRTDNEKYILMIAYTIGIATGVHLMAILAIVPVTMVILFRKYLVDEEACKKTAYIFLVHAALLIVISLAMWASSTSTTPPSPEEYQAYDTKFKLIAFGISALIMGIFYKQVFTRNSFYLPLIIGGAALFIVYPGVVKMLPGLMASIAGDNSFLAAMILAVILGALWYVVMYAKRADKPTLHLITMSFILVLIGFTTYSMIIIRSNMNPPMNENEPDKLTELVSYLNREQYGDFPIFKRRFSTEPHQHGSLYKLLK